MKTKSLFWIVGIGRARQFVLVLVQIHQALNAVVIVALFPALDEGASFIRGFPNLF